MNSLLAAFVLAFAPQGQSQAAQAPDLSKPVTFERVAMPAKRLLAELGQQAGVNLDTSSQTAGETLVVRVENVPLQSLLDQIAKAVDGEWQKEDGLLRLIRPSANFNRELAEERRQKIADLQKELKKQADAMAKSAQAAKAAANAKPGDPEMPQFEVPFFGSSSKAILQLVSRLNLGDLVSSEDDHRVVFSSSPTRMQKLLPGNLDPIVAELVAEHNKNAANMRKANEEVEKDEEMQKWEEFMKAFGMGLEEKPIEGRPAKMLLIGEEAPYFGGLAFKLRLYSAKGETLLEQDMSLGMSDFMDEAMEMAQESGVPLPPGVQKPAKPAPAGDDKVIEFSQDTKDLNELFQSFTQPGSTRKKFSKSLEEKVARPDLYDPLSFEESESLLTLAKHKKLNLVACLPDGGGSMLSAFAGPKKTVNAYLQSIEASKDLKLDRPAGWLVVSPARPAEARRRKADRVALARLIAAAKSKGSPSLDDVAAYALTSPSPMEDSTIMQYIMLFAPSAMQQGMSGILDWNAVRLYGTLNPIQRQTLANKGRLPFGQLSPQQKGLLGRILFGSQHGLKPVDPNAKPKEDQGFMEMIGGYMGTRRQADYRSEPTEVMPLGLPGDGWLAADLEKELVGIAVGSDPILDHGVLGADELAMFRYFKEDPNMAMMAGMMPQVNQLRLGDRNNITLKLFVNPTVNSEKTLQDSHVPANGPVVGIDKLPKELQDKIDRRLAALKKSPMPGFGDFGGPGKPPPASRS